MAWSQLERLLRVVRDDLEGHFCAQPAQLKSWLRQVVELLVTAQRPTELAELVEWGEIRGLKTHLAALEKFLQRQSMLPEAICARYKYRSSQAQALSRYRISAGVWNCFHRLAREVGWDPELQVPLVAYEKFAWHDELEERIVNAEIILDSQALENMLMCVLEGYLSPRANRRKGYEVYGVNLGMVRSRSGRRAGDGISITNYVYVMHSQPQLSAEGANGSVAPNPRSLDAILQASAALYPQYQVVGDFHSHPYQDLPELEERKGWRFTREDEQSNISLAAIMAERGHRLAVSFVITIARSGQRISRSHYRGMRNTIQLSLGNCRVIVAAYRSLESGRLTDVNARLRLAGVAH